MIPTHCPYCQSVLFKDSINAKYYSNGNTVLCAKIEMEHFFKFTQFDTNYNNWQLFHHKTKIGISKNRLWKESQVSVTAPDITLIKFDSNLNYQQAADYLKRYLKLLSFQ